MSALFWRILIAVICVVLVYAGLPHLVDLLGIAVPGSAMALIRIAIAGIALFYILRGPSPPRVP